MYLLGGSDNPTQISMISDCDVQSIGSLPFNFRFGGCGAINDEILFMCFSYKENFCRKSTGQFDEWDFEPTSETMYARSEVRVAASSGKTHFSLRH